MRIGAGWRSSDKLLVPDWKQEPSRGILNISRSASSPTIVSLLVFVTMMANGEREGFLVREKSILRCTGSKLRRDGISRDGM